MRFMKLGLLASIYAYVTAKSNRHSRVDRMWRMQKKRCEENDCRHFDDMRNKNCLHRCISSSCFHEIYGEQPLEDGEVDDYRYNKYVICLRKDYKNRVKQARDEL